MQTTINGGLLVKVTDYFRSSVSCTANIRFAPTVVRNYSLSRRAGQGGGRGFQEDNCTSRDHHRLEIFGSSRNLGDANSADIYEQAVVKTVAGFFSRESQTSIRHHSVPGAGVGDGGVSGAPGRVTVKVVPWVGLLATVVGENQSRVPFPFLHLAVRPPQAGLRYSHRQR